MFQKTNWAANFLHIFIVWFAYFANILDVQSWLWLKKFEVANVSIISIESFVKSFVLTFKWQPFKNYLNLYISAKQQHLKR